MKRRTIIFIIILMIAVIVIIIGIFLFMNRDNDNNNRETNNISYFTKDFTIGDVIYNETFVGFGNLLCFSRNIIYYSYDLNTLTKGADTFNHFKDLFY